MNEREALYIGKEKFKGEQYDEALAILTPLVAEGCPEALFYVGLMYHEGLGPRENEAEALRLYRAAATAGFAEAQFKLSTAYGYHSGGPSQEEAFRWLSLAAEQGHLEAQYLLAASLATGEGVEKSQEDALKWYERAAAAGHAEAQYNAALMHLLGEGTNKDEARALTLLKQSADQGFEDAKKFLDQM